MPGKDIYPVQGADHLWYQGVFGFRIYRIVNHPTAVICYDQAGQALIVDHAQRLLDGAGGHDFQSLQLVGSQLGFFQHGCLLVAVEHHLADLRAVDIQKQQHNKCDDNIGHRIAKLYGTVSAVLFLITSGSNNQRPTSS